MRKVSIVIPVIRTEKVRECISAIEENTGIPVSNYEIITAYDRNNEGCPAMVATLTELARHDLVMFLGDDTEPQEDFLKHALDAMESLPDGWGVVGLNTQDIRVEEGNPIAHWMADKRMLEHIPGGDFFSTDYNHCWCDNELKDIAAEMGRWKYAKLAKIKHNHPVNMSAPEDEMYDRAYSHGNQEHDKKAYCTRKRARRAKEYGVKLAIALPLTDDKVYNQFFFSFLSVLTTYMAKGVTADILMPDFPGQIDAIRNNLVQQALNLGCTHILMMDTDQIYATPDMINQMLDHDKPVVGARVHRRYPPFDSLMMRGNEGALYAVPDEDIRNEDGSFNKEVSVDYTGTGCIMYDTRVFIDMIPAKWFQFKTGEKGQPVGEDIGFCTELKKAGIPIIVDASIDIKHLTLLAADWGTHKLFGKLMNSSAKNKA